MVPSFSNTQKSRLILILACLTVWLWIGLAVILNESQLGDSLEQFIWAQSFEWGYWKHPPMSSWLLYSALHFLSPSYIWTYVLSGLLYTVTLVSTYKISALLFDHERATWSVLLLTLHYGFTRRAQLYNHNSVLVAFIAVTVLLTLLALKEQKTWHWLIAGLFAGFSLLVKYQAIFPLTGIFAAILLTRQFGKSKLGLIVAFVVCLLVLSPHLIWILDSEFQTITYALNYVESSDLSSRSERQVAFLLTQLRYYLPMIFFIGLLSAIRYVNKDKVHKSLPLSLEQRSWSVGLIAIPLAMVLFISLALGVRLQGHWGLQTTQFLCILVAYWIFNVFGRIDTTKIYAWLAIQIIAIAIFIGQGAGLILYANSALALRELPAKSLTSQTIAFWNSKTNCSLQYISGVSFMTAVISAYSGTNLKVLEDGDYQKSPWIHESDLQKFGYLEVLISDVPVLSSDTHSIPYLLVSHDELNQPGQKYLVLKYHAPSHTCH